MSTNERDLDKKNIANYLYIYHLVHPNLKFT